MGEIKKNINWTGWGILLIIFTIALTGLVIAVIGYNRGVELKNRRITWPFLDDSAPYLRPGTYDVNTIFSTLQPYVRKNLLNMSGATEGLSQLYFSESYRVLVQYAENGLCVGGTSIHALVKNVNGPNYTLPFTLNIAGVGSFSRTRVDLGNTVGGLSRGNYQAAYADYQYREGDQIEWIGLSFRPGISATALVDTLDNTGNVFLSAIIDDKSPVGTCARVYLDKYLST